VSLKVLMVDDEEHLVWSTGRQITRERPDYQFDGVTDPREAVERIQGTPPDLLITDVRMPGMSGLELILAARKVAPALPVVVVTAYGSAEVRAQIERSQGVAYVEKPFSFQSLLQAMDKVTSETGGFSGAISLPMLPDLIQMCALSQITGCLRIGRGQQQGHIWLASGDIVHADCGGTEGVEAVYEILTWTGGTFSLDSGAAAPRTTISANWQEILVEGCRLMDEAQRDREESGYEEMPAPGAEAAPSASLAEQLQELGPALAEVIRNTAPDATLVAVSLRGEGTLALQGKGEAAPWAELAAWAVDAAERIAGEGSRGSVESVARDFGIGIAWDRRAGLALVLASSLTGESQAHFRVGFRAKVARWNELSEGRA